MTYQFRFSLFLILIANAAFGQAPSITHVDKYVNGNGQKVIISGSNFGSAGDLIVWFGAAQGTIENATDQTIEVSVPPGATYESIVVTNTATKRSAWSTGEFMLSYGGEHPISATKLIAQTDLDAESGLYDLCMCDLDGDGKTDVAGANSGSISAPLFGVSIFRNISTDGGAVTFAAKVSMLASTKTINIKCGDLNGDGKKDLVITEADPGTRVFILKNNSTTGSLSFAAQNISIAGSSPKRVDIADLDADGLPELVITDQNTGNRNFLVVPNTSSGATISFGPPVVIPVPDNGSDGLAIQDLNGDNRADIIVSHVLSSAGNVFVYKNESHPGDFSFATAIKADIAPGTPNNTGAPVNVRVGDIDGDSNPDIVVTHFLGSKVSVLRNTGSGGSIGFATPVSVTTDVFPFGLDLGDIDGDGKLDIVAASLTGPVTEPNPKSLTIINNKSTAGSISFETPIIKATAFVNRHVLVGDLNGDSKPDIAYTSVDDNTRGVPASRISFFRNTTCITPKITPPGPMVVCASFPVALEATKSAGATYAWSKDGTPLGVTTQNYLPSASGVYTVDITSDGCAKTSEDVNFTWQVAGAAAPPTINENSPLCEGGTINLSIATPIVGETYNWTGPAGFIASGTSVTRASYQAEFAGRYEVEVITGGCIAAKESVLVETISLPAFNVSFTGSDVICTSDSKLLTAVPNDTNFSYQWFDDGGNIGGATTSTHTVTATGSYGFKATSLLYPGCPQVTAEAVDILMATTPVVNFQSPAETCRNVVTNFTDQSTVQANADPTYKWNFGDAATSTEKNATHTYTSLGNLNVTLTVSYRDNACTTISAPKPITISPPPTATITSEGNVFEFCNGEQITLGVSAPFNEYKWSTDETTPTINVTTGGTYEVQLKNEIGCRITVSQPVSIKPAPDITITAEKNPINLGETSKLTASSGFADYEWTPAESLDDPSSQTPIASPVVETEYTVAVVGPNGCPGAASILLAVVNGDPANLLKISNFFSPNDDDSNPFWTIEGPQVIMQTCEITIFDERGSKVFEAKPYNNDWDGTNSGKKLPDGVYYYTIRCDGASKAKSGSITILR
jgi:gliding motility-associated-like protein